MITTRVRPSSVGSISRLASRVGNSSPNGPVATQRNAITVTSPRWYVGIFAETYPDYMMMGELMTTMVANDAFTQALSNPLLARNVYTDTTFTATGRKIINDTTSLQHIVARNSHTPDDVYVNFTCTNPGG